MKIINANINYIDKILGFARDAFGDGFLSAKSLETQINNESTYLVIAVDEKNELLGFASAKVCNIEEFNDEVLHPVHLKDDIENVGWIKQVVVHQYHQRKNIGTQLVNYIENQLKNKSDVILCISWHKGDSTPMSLLLEKNNFYEITFIKNYWGFDSIIKQYNCIICGMPPCKCSAAVYKKSNF